MNDTGRLFKVDFDDQSRRIALSKLGEDGSGIFTYYISYEVLEGMDRKSASEFLGDRLLLMSEHFRRYFSTSPP